MASLTRRDLLAGGFAWFPFFGRRDERTLAGIRFRVIRKGSSGRRYLRIHGNEETAARVLTDHMQQAHGIAYLVRNTDRNVRLGAGRLDPNRMFSLDGAQRNLRTLNPDWLDRQLLEGLLFLDEKRHEVVDAVRPQTSEILIALHNNGPGYSVQDEVPISDRAALNDREHPHEFCLCTTPGDFERLSTGPFNVVLQNAAPKEDDGSLSRLAVRRGFRYVNIECAHGEYQKQRAILDWVEKTV